MDTAKGARHLLVRLHVSGFDVSVKDGDLVITADPTATFQVDQPLLDMVAPYREELLRMLADADAALDRIRQMAAQTPTKGKP